MIFLICSLFFVFFLTGPVATPLSARAEQEPEPLVTIIFFEMELREALRELALQTGVNIVMDENITGTVTLELENAPLEKALQMMLAGGGFSYRKVDDYYLVGLADPKNRVFADLAETEFYFFKNTKVSTVEALLPEAFRQNVRFDPETNVAAVTAPHGLRERIIADFKKIDTPRAQVRVKALVSEVQTEVVKEWGIDLLNWEFTSSLTKKPDWTAVLGLAPGTLALETDIYGLLHTKIRALEKEGTAKIHADPVVQVADGKTADLFIGEQRVLILDVYETYDQVEKIEAGTGLKVTPRVFEDRIELELTQTVSYFVDNNSSQPVVRLAEFASTLRLIPGQTILVSGLTQVEGRDRMSRTPVLGRIPLIRLFFRESRKEKKESELLLFISAEVVEEND
jgi:type IV pilus assembly protein PilQ